MIHFESPNSAVPCATPFEPRNEKEPGQTVLAAPASPSVASAQLCFSTTEAILLVPNGGGGGSKGVILHKGYWGKENESKGRMRRCELFGPPELLLHATPAASHAPTPPPSAGSGTSAGPQRREGEQGERALVTNADVCLDQTLSSVSF